MAGAVDERQIGLEFVRPGGTAIGTVRFPVPVWRSGENDSPSPCDGTATLRMGDDLTCYSGLVHLTLFTYYKSIAVSGFQEFCKIFAVRSKTRPHRCPG